MSSFKFAVVICHGSYHTPAPYQPLIDALESRSIETHSPQRPTCDLNNLNIGDPQNPDFNRPPPESGYPAVSEDAAVVGDLVDELISEDKSVLLVAHSSGGWVASEAATSERQAPFRKERGQPGGDGSIVKPSWIRLYKYGFEGVATLADPVKYMFNDVELAEAEMWATTLTAAPTPTSPLTHDPYSWLPCVFLVLENDLTLPKEYQEGMIAAHNAVNERKISILRVQLPIRLILVGLPGYGMKLRNLGLGS